MTVLTRRPQPVQRSCPTAEVYDVEAIVARRQVQAPAATASGSVRKPWFFAAAKDRVESDPFLQRLSRLG